MASNIKQAIKRGSPVLMTGGGGGGGGGDTEDTSPGPFAFDPVVDAWPGDTYESNIETLAGTDADADISISGVGGYYRIDGGAYTQAPGTISPGATFQVRGVAGATLGGTVTALLQIGDILGGFSITTEEDVLPDGAVGLPAIPAPETAT
jgi:hypothetical protein